MSGYKKSIVLALVLTIVMSGNAQNQFQSFYNSNALTLFNQGDYKTSLDSMSVWRDKNDSERGLITYFMAEAYYCLAFRVDGKTVAREYFNLALEAFNQAIKASDLATLNPEKVLIGKYKSAWCQYRLGSLTDNPLTYWDQAASAFEAISKTHKDTVGIKTGLLSIYIDLRSAEFNRIQMISAKQGVLGLEAAQKAIRHLARARVKLNNITDSDLVSSRFTNMKKWLGQRVSFENWRLYISMDETVFSEVNDPDKQNTCVATASKLLSNSVQNDIPGNSLWLSDFNKNDLFSKLHLYLLSSESKDEQALNSALDRMAATVDPSVLSLIRGFRDYNHATEDRIFQRLAGSNGSHFDRASQSLVEGWYWLGWTQFILNMPEAQDSYRKFITASQNYEIDQRLMYLREEAQYRLFYIQFENALGQRQRLSELAASIDRFNPQNSKIVQQKTTLAQLIKIVLVDLNDSEVLASIWNDALQGRRSDKQRQTRNLSEEMLFRATRVTGLPRKHYLDHLDALLRLLESFDEPLSTFYKGLSVFLRAEIQTRPAAKLSIYERAAQSLETVKEPFVTEASYIVARSYFAAAKHAKDDSQIEQLYEKARPLLIDLISNHQSVRALYYLGEIYRLEGEHKLAVQCYQVVEDKTRGQAGGSFWTENARSAIKTCSDIGTKTDLAWLKMESVDYPDELLIVDGRVISLERFADRKYIRRQFWRDAIDLFVQFGWEPDRVSASVNTLRPVANNYRATNLNFGFHDCMGVLTCGLALTIIKGDVQGDIIVTLGDEELIPDTDGIYRKSPIRLGQSAALKIEGSGSIPYLQHFNFREPVYKRVTIALAEKISFVVDTKSDNGESAMIQLNSRQDRNNLFKSGSQPLGAGTELIADFKSDILFRDFVYSAAHKKYLVLNNTTPFVRTYQDNGNVRASAPIVLSKVTEGPRLSNPEGITVDMAGNIYIADWSEHRILIFSRNGAYIRQVGSKGKNNPHNMGNGVKLLYPKRIAIVEDIQGVATGEDKVFRPIYMLIADRNGVYLADGFGQYWGSLNLPGSLSHDLYDMKVEGYGKQAKLYVFDRQGQVVRTLTAQ
ncbi:tetratricopeptide repeat protein [bacterium]|nr:tetratricopeptide repeat protein [bacterium]